MLPPSLLNVVNRLEGFTTNLFRLEANGASGPYRAQQIIQFDLPANSVINLRSLKIFFNVALTSDTTNAAGGAIRLPANINTLIERVEVSAGGIQLSQGSNYTNVLVAARDALLGTRADPMTGHPVIPLYNGYDQAQTSLLTNAATNGGAMRGFLDETYPDLLAFDTFPGFLESAPPLLDTSLMPDITIRLTLAPNAVLGVTGNTANSTIANFAAAPTTTVTSGSYTLTNLHAMIESVSFADSMYSQMLSSQMASEGYLELPYNTYHQISNTHSNSSRFTVATQSLDHVWMVWRNAAFGEVTGSNLGLLKQVAGTNPLVAGMTTQSTAISALTGVQTTYAFSPLKPLGDYPEFRTDYFNFQKPANLTDIQLQLNGTLYPQWRAGPVEWGAITKNSLGVIDPALTPARYNANNFVCVSRHNFPESDGRLSNISGIDTRAVNLQGVVNTSGAANTTYLYIFLQCTSTLRVGSGRAIVPIP